MSTVKKGLIYEWNSGKLRRWRLGCFNKQLKQVEARPQRRRYKYACRVVNKHHNGTLAPPAVDECYYLIMSDYKNARRLSTCHLEADLIV